MGTKEKTRVSWCTVIVLAVILTSLIVVHVIPYSSERITWEYTACSNDVGQIPQIEAIGISHNSKSYISIGGKFACEGDIVNGFKILNIDPNKVEFYKNGKTFVGVINSTQKLIEPSISLLRQSPYSKKYYYEDSDSYYKPYIKQLYSNPYIAENSSYYGQISENTGRPKTVYVKGYYRKDGTYVRSHYRSPPR